VREPAASHRETVETFRTPDGVKLRYTLRSRGHRRIVLVVPGIFMHRESREHTLLAARLLETADVATLDVRGHGDSEGAFTWGRREPDDVAAVAGRLRADYPKVGGLGFSFGGYHTAVAAAQARPFDAVALVAAPRNLFILDHNFLTGGLWRSIPIMLRRSRRFVRLSPWAFRTRAGAARLAHRISPTPLLVVHGSDDWLIPPKHARTLFARAGEPKSLLLLPGALHAENILVDEPQALLEPLVAFFDEKL
jgi:pimeloyl-ACP methyl ester carboxylesterase